MDKQKFDYQAYFNDIFRILDRMNEVYNECGAPSMARKELELLYSTYKADVPEQERVEGINKLEEDFYRGYPVSLQKQTNFQIKANGAIGVCTLDNPLQPGSLITHFQTPLGNIDITTYTERDPNFLANNDAGNALLKAREFGCIETNRHRCAVEAFATRLPWKQNLPAPEYRGFSPDAEKPMPKEEAEAIFTKVKENYINGITTPVYRGDVEFEIDDEGRV
ncbi:MAG: hypothetical protein FWC68_05490 [Oscillospiraceae bacterium]|nr:hypothetical protein [Oscillospiraceae bacterium]